MKAKFKVLPNEHGTFDIEVEGMGLTRNLLEDELDDTLDALSYLYHITEFQQVFPTLH